jgi:ribosomal protection tetracycline resistance protein
MKSLNIGILAHVDAGKTSLTERLLFNAGVIKTLGSVDQGNTQTDTMTLERQRGITIKAAVTSFDVGNLKINLIDTPGHPDFIAEVERSLRVLDAVVLVISAVEGVQPQTRILMHALQKLHIPTLIFINKIDRMGARDIELVENIKDRLFPHVIAMNSVTDLGTRKVEVANRTNNQAYVEELQTILANNSELFLGDLLNNPEKLDVNTYHKELMTQIRHMQVCPIIFGSAIKGVGVPQLTKALETYFIPPPANSDVPLSGIVFKIERGARGEKIAYVRVYSGEMHVRSQVECGRLKANDTFATKITALQAFKNGATIETSVASGGDIVKVWGLNDCAINDYVGHAPHTERKPYLARPSLEVIVTSCAAQDAPRLYSALQQISEQDPFIEVRQNPRDKVLSLRLCGEVQKEVIEDTLANEYNVQVEFHNTTTICIERPVGVGSGLESGVRGDLYLGTVGLRIEPGPINSGIEYRLASSVLGTMPKAFFIAIEETVKEVLREGVYGWQVTDCIVTLTRTGYYPRQSHAHANFDKSMSSTAGDFRNMTPLALMQALKEADTHVDEPMNRFELDVPQTVLAQVMQGLTDAEARLNRPPTTNKEIVKLEGLIPARRTFEFERSAPDLTGGEGVFVTEFGEYQAVQGIIPARKRTDNNPLDRQEYLRRTFSRG